MDSLVRQAAAMDADRDATADYEIHADVLKLIPKSFLEHRPLSKVERPTTSRNHQAAARKSAVLAFTPRCHFMPKRVHDRPGSEINDQM
jgi:hypothetical protein